jgi:hypothetical protein
MILFYAAEKNRVVETIEEIVAEQLPSRHLVHCRSLVILEQRLRRPSHNIEILLISINDAIEMRQLYAMRPLLLDLRLVMVLPGREADIVAWAHKLSPRFIAYADNGFEQVGAVLEKMVLAQKIVPLRMSR